MQALAALRTDGGLGLWSRDDGGGRVRKDAKCLGPGCILEEAAVGLVGGLAAGGEGKGGIKGDHQVSGLSSESVRLTFTERMGRAILVGKSGVPSWTLKSRCLLGIYEERTRRHLAIGVWGRSSRCQRAQGTALANISTPPSVSFSLSSWGPSSVSFSLSSWGPWGTELKKQWLHRYTFLNIKWVQLPSNGALPVLFSSPIPAHL